MPPPNNKSMMMNTRPGRIGGDSDESETPSNNLWVGNLASDVADSDLMDLFAQYGALDSVTSYSSRSYAFVFFKRIEDAKAAKDTLQGADLHGHPIKIEFARPVCSHQFVLLLCVYKYDSFRDFEILCSFLCVSTTLEFQPFDNDSLSNQIPRRMIFFFLILGIRN